MTNRRSRRFRSDWIESETLERRLVLSSGLKHLATTAPAVVLKKQTLPVSQSVDLAFDRFIDAYGQARSIYYASVTGPDPGSVSNAAFLDYTTQRVNLLAQELIAGLQAAAPKSSKGHGANTANDLRTLVVSRINRRIASTDPATNGQPAGGTLLKALRDSAPAVAASTPLSSQTAAFQMLAQDSAVETARSAILNGVASYRIKLSTRKG